MHMDEYENRFIAALEQGSITPFLYSDRFLLTLNLGYGSKTVLFADILGSDKVA